jgi:hypothetical protein
MGKHYYIELSRNDIGIVSYFPGLELKDDMNYDWIDDVLVPVVKPIAERKSKKKQDTPITFWTCVRNTARRRAEIFLFVTPAYPGKLIEDALSKALEPFIYGKVHAGIERLPEYAYPCLQVFRGKLIKFYLKDEAAARLYLPSIISKDDASHGYEPALDIIPTYGPIEEEEELGLTPVEARILTVSNGNECRKFQQSLTPIAMEVD